MVIVAGDARRIRVDERALHFVVVVLQLLTEKNVLIESRIK